MRRVLRELGIFGTLLWDGGKKTCACNKRLCVQSKALVKPRRAKLLPKRLSANAKTDTRLCTRPLRSRVCGSECSPTRDGHSM